MSDATELSGRRDFCYLAAVVSASGRISGISATVCTFLSKTATFDRVWMGAYGQGPERVLSWLNFSLGICCQDESRQSGGEKGQGEETHFELKWMDRYSRGKG